ncbi:hypothetical protein DOK78_001834 [Enterococcus sp. DIV2402]|uniref:N-acetyltransferase domain-containing protein n=1 Tax=Candidatus Enterococcus lowellii TaxID=2230877 RepID=A0ABZ2SRY1_9ENTE|nr:GNAT family N-acetyltransferase [Enterococcus sp. DIV2402]
MIIIREAEIVDDPQLLALYQELIPIKLSPKEAEQTTLKLINDKNYFLVVAKEEDEVLGTALGICCQAVTVPFLVIEDVIVKEDTRGKGIGRKLMAALDEFAIGSNCAYAILVSSGHRTVAHQFYENVGFAEDVRGFRKSYIDM